MEAPSQMLENWYDLYLFVVGIVLTRFAGVGNPKY